GRDGERADPERDPAALGDEAAVAAEARVHDDRIARAPEALDGDDLAVGEPGLRGARGRPALVDAAGGVLVERGRLAADVRADPRRGDHAAGTGAQPLDDRAYLDEARRGDRRIVEEEPLGRGTHRDAAQARAGGR